MDTNVLFRGLSFAVGLIQVGAVILLRRHYKLAFVLILVSPLLVLAVTLSAIARVRAWPNLTGFELCFLFLEVIAATTSFLGLLRVPAPAFFWISWVISLYACAVVTYLAFFFAIHF